MNHLISCGRRQLAVLLAVALFFQFVGPLPRLHAENKAARAVASGVIGFLAGATIMTALGVGGLAVFAGVAASVYIGKWVGKNFNSFFKARKKDVTQSDKAVVGIAVTSAQRLQDQEVKAAKFINSLTGQGAQGSANQPDNSAQVDEAMARYQDAYRAYSNAVQRGDSEAAKKFGEQYRNYQAQYQALLKGQNR